MVTMIMSLDDYSDVLDQTWNGALELLGSIKKVPIAVQFNGDDSGRILWLCGAFSFRYQ